ncbi:hypothetical protein [Thalassotalea sp. G2M2-11]|uniref:hypothetical protein n=1 Tax=Thalassotalea sp. G2M2-11 TaxID=2787627 RepID=UPI0019D2C026|nr:hypothetical protein [Thalassotalea sp. G2M2-11]
MSERKDTDLAKQFAKWLENRTRAEAQPTSEQTFNGDSQWQARHETANYLAHHVELHQQAQVPHWDREATFMADKRAWWQWQGLPVMSLAFSCMAMALVLFKVEVLVQDNGITLSFADAQKRQQQITQLVDQRLQTFASEQQVILANYAADIKVQQQESNLELASYIMGASRQERKEDMTDFIQYINAQRADEQYEQNMKFKQLERAINYQQANLNTGIQNIGMQSQPAAWTTEEE